MAVHFLKFSLYNFYSVLFQFPYCDGAHKQYNKETGDNTGPLKIKATTA